MKSKKICLVITGLLLVTAFVPGVVKANCTVEGYLTTSVHYVPVLQDKATATTGVSYNGKELSKVTSKTTVYAYNADGDYDKDTVTAQGAAAVEGQNSAVASIRSMKRAKGVHSGKNATVSNYVTTNTSWHK